MKYRLVSGVLISTVVAQVAFSGSVFAWHPKGVIVKKVQNQTTKSVLSDANTTADAVAAKPGDIMDYVIEIKNVAPAAPKQYNDMAFIVMTDTLPEGVELADGSGKRQISEKIDLIKPGQSVTKTYKVKVTANKDGVITNKACFTGDSVVKDNPQKGCDNAVVKVAVPVTPKPEEPKKPVEKPVEKPVVKPTPQVKAEVTPAPTPTVLPETGTSNVAAAVAGTTVLGYFIRMAMLKKRLS